MMQDVSIPDSVLPENVYQAEKRITFMMDLATVRQLVKVRGGWVLATCTTEAGGITADIVGDRADTRFVCVGKHDDGSPWYEQIISVVD